MLESDRFRGLKSTHHGKPSESALTKIQPLKRPFGFLKADSLSKLIHARYTVEHPE
jgi:hypothetical protein